MRERENEEHQQTLWKSSKINPEGTHGPIGLDISMYRSLLSDVTRLNNVSQNEMLIPHKYYYTSCECRSFLKYYYVMM